MSKDCRVDSGDINFPGVDFETAGTDTDVVDGCSGRNHGYDLRASIGAICLGELPSEHGEQEGS